MEINNPQFLTSAATVLQYAEASGAVNLPEICVVGRSNVGKSTFINTLVRRKSIAKTSSTPGRTRLVNLFDIDGRFLLVDLPGYGYAEASKREREKWGDMIEGYFSASKSVRLVLMLVDCRHAPSALDITMAQFLYANRLPFTVLATKADKLSKSAVSRAVQTVATGLKLGRDNITPVSNNGLNRDRVLDIIDGALADE